MDLDKLNAYNLSAQEVERAIQTENIETPGGRMVRGPNEMGVRTLGRVEQRRGVQQHHHQERRRRADPRSRYRLRAEDGMAEKRTFAYYKDKPAVMLDVRRQIGTNTVKVVDEITAKLDKHQQDSCRPASRSTSSRSRPPTSRRRFRRSKSTCVLGSLLASFIVWLFIRDWRMVLISSIAIPTSIITTFTFMRLMDFTLNSMTLLGLTLAVGIVIDDAIIVMENIYRFIEEKGLPPMRRRFRRPRRLRWRLSRPRSRWSSSSSRSRSCPAMRSAS